MLVDHDETVQLRIQQDPEFAMMMLDEASKLMFEGEPGAARVLLRNVVKGTLGFQGLSQCIGKDVKSLHRMLSPRGNPTMDNLSGILHALKNFLEQKPTTRKPRRKAV